MQDTVHNNMAKFAYEKVIKVDEGKKEFRSLARSFPSIIQVNGLGVAVAFLLSKKTSSAHIDMYMLIEDWIKVRFCLNDKSDLMQHIITLDSGIYRIYANEIMNLCLWVKRFAEGIIDSGLEENL